MRRHFATLLALASFFGAASVSADTLAITHVVVIDATGAPPQPDMTVSVRDGRIAELGTSTAMHAPADAEDELIKGPKGLGLNVKNYMDTDPLPVRKKFVQMELDGDSSDAGLTRKSCKPVGRGPATIAAPLIGHLIYPSAFRA
jgi:hypothetical protein